MSSARELRKSAEAERRSGRGARARKLYEEAVSLLRASSDRLLFAHTLRHLGDVCREQGDLRAAAACYDEALLVYRNAADAPVLDVANAVRSQAVLKEQTSSAEEAAALWEEARRLYLRANVIEGFANSSGRLASLRLRSGDRGEARRVLDEGFAAAESSGDAETLGRLAEIRAAIDP